MTYWLSPHQSFEDHRMLSYMLLNSVNIPSFVLLVTLIALSDYLTYLVVPLLAEEASLIYLCPLLYRTKAQEVLY